jgi:ABC-2 type transport system ATP-binding protein
MAVIVSSHLLSEMEMMCDRIAIIQSGKLVEVQNIREFVQDPKQKYLIELELQQEADLSFLTDIPFVKKESGIEVELEKEKVPELIRLLVQNGLNLYEVKAVSKTLEERFLEVTNKGEEHSA